MDSSTNSRFVSNPHLKLLEDDMLFHIGMKAGDHENIRNLFGDVKVRRYLVIKPLQAAGIFEDNAQG